jgi:hypothetical protein
MKLRDLRAYVVVGSRRTGQHNGQIQTMDPSNLMPGEAAKIFLYLSCDFAGRGGSYSGSSDLVVLLPDVSGRTENLEKPGTTPLFDAAERPGGPSSSPVPAPTPRPR